MNSWQRCGRGYRLENRHAMREMVYGYDAPSGQFYCATEHVYNEEPRSHQPFASEAEFRTLLATWYHYHNPEWFAGLMGRTV